MQLIAVKRISDQLPEGALFEQDDARARMLIAIGFAKPYDDPDPPVRRQYRRRSPDPSTDPEPAA